MSDNDLLDWTIANAPPDGGLPAEPLPPGPLAPAPPRRPPRWPRSRWVWIILGGVIVVAIAMVAVALPRLEVYRARRAVGAVIALEDQALLDADWDALKSYYDEDAGAWAAIVLDRLQQGYPPAALPVPWATAEREPGQLARFELLNPTLARAGVARGYLLTDGRQATFALPQYYRYRAGAWRRIAPPLEVWSERQTYLGARVEVSYYPADADFALPLGQYLDGLLEQACAGWDCPPDLRVQVQFQDSRADVLRSQPSYGGQGSLVFHVATGRLLSLVDPVVYVPSRLSGGYPLDEAASDAARHALAAQVLLQAARASAPGTVTHDHTNAYLYALLVRELVRLGVEAPRLAQLRIANPLFTPEQLWALPGLDYGTAGGLPQALALLNVALAAVPASVEGALLPALAAASDPAAWLSQGLSLSRAEAEARLASATAEPFPAIMRPEFPAALALACEHGPRLAALDGRSAPLLEGDFVGALILGWSPDGRRLALSLSGRSGIADVDGGTGQWLPEASSPYAAGPAWASSTVIAYVTAQINLDDQSSWVTPGALHFFDTADPARAIAPLPQFQQVLLAPDGRWAALYSWMSNQLALLPAGVDTPVPLGQGGPPSWSGDGRQLVYTQNGAGGRAYAIRVAEVPLSASTPITPVQWTLFEGDDPNVPALPAESQYVQVTPAWSPDGTQIAVTAYAYEPGISQGWAALWRMDGSGLRLLAAPGGALAPFGARFSSDGEYLLVDFAGLGPARSVLYDARSGERLRDFTDFSTPAWSPAGHILALLDQDGLALLPEPADASAAPQRLEAQGCYSVAWRPQ